MIDLVGVSVEYPIYDSRGRSFKQALLANLGGRLARNQKTGRVVVQALRDLTLSFRPGDRVGLIGRNGAGKSTLLKVLAGIYEPQAGRVRIEGGVTSLLDVTTGLDFEATGYENIVMRNLLLGMTLAEARAKIPEIEAFTELGEYLKLSLRTYSNGMVLRLAFGIATGAESDILVLDEVMGAGDAAFSVKAQQRLESMVGRTKILVMASHVESMISAFCTRGIVLSGGQMVFDGPVGDALEFYRSSPA
jgi:ABC-2 type transport system ATP-binding protein/lipopolysaccharide transport system ATP-binding protein